MTSKLFTDPSDDYSLPKAINLHDEYDEARTWIHTQAKEQVLFEQQERELEFDEPRWGEMGGEDE